MRKILITLCGTLALVLAGLCLILLDAPKEPEKDTPSASAAPPNFGGASAPQNDARDTTVDALLQSMSLEEKVGQLFFARCPAAEEAAQVAALQPGGYLLFARDFKDRTPDSLRDMLDECQQASKIPMLFGVDEEGGTVVRASQYKQYRERKFQSPQSIYAAGGLDAIRADAAEKAQFLKDLGINVNLAPVCDVSTDSNDFMYSRAFGKDAEATAAYVRVVVEEMQAGGVGGVLKHFPGYGNNGDTHTSVIVDERPLDDFLSSDFLPFEAGIDAGAGCVLVSHNIVEAMDAEHPASLSAEVHRYLRETLGFTGVVLTDDLAMDAIANDIKAEEAAVRALQAGNDMVISSDIMAQIPAVLGAVEEGELDIAQINASARRMLLWKYDLGLLA